MVLHKFGLKLIMCVGFFSYLQKNYYLTSKTIRLKSTWRAYFKKKNVLKLWNGHPLLLNFKSNF